MRVNDDACVYVCACACVLGNQSLLLFLFCFGIVVFITLEGHIVNEMCIYALFY